MRVYCFVGTLRGNWNQRVEFGGRRFPPCIFSPIPDIVNFLLSPENRKLRSSLQLSFLICQVCHNLCQLVSDNSEQPSFLTSDNEWEEEEQGALYLDSSRKEQLLVSNKAVLTTCWGELWWLGVTETQALPSVCHHQSSHKGDKNLAEFRGGFRFLFRGPSRVFTPGGALSPTFAQNRGFPLKIAWKLHDFGKILRAKGQGSQSPSPGSAGEVSRRDS